MFKENDLKWPLVVRDDVRDWHSATSYEWMRSVYEPQDLADESFKVWDSEGYRIHLQDYFPSGYELLYSGRA